MAEEAQRLRNDIAKCTKMREVLEKRVKTLETEKSMLTMELDKVRQMTASMETEVQQSKKAADLDKRQIEGLTREKEIMSKSILRHQGIYVKKYSKFVIAHNLYFI